MTGYESALRVLCTQAQFERAAAAVEVARAAQSTALARQQVDTCTSRREAAAAQLLEICNRPRVNPPLLRLLQRLYHSESSLLRGLQQRLAEAEQCEGRARAALADFHNRDLGLQRALHGEQRKCAQRRVTVEMTYIDDMWLQRVLREDV